MKKLFGTMAVAVALFAGYSAYEAQNSESLNDIALANVEALAENTEEDEGATCGTKSEMVDDTSLCDGDNPNQSGFIGIVYSKTTGNDKQYSEGMNGILYNCTRSDGTQINSVRTHKCNENLADYLLK